MKWVCYHNNGIACDTNNQQQTDAESARLCHICAMCTLMLVFVVVRRVKTKNGSTSLNCTNNIKRFYNARLHAIFKANGARTTPIWFSVSPHNVQYKRCACTGLQFAYFMWSLLWMVRFVPSWQHVFDRNSLLYFSWCQRIFRLPWFLFRSVIVIALERSIASYINIFFIYAAWILKTLVTTIAAASQRLLGDGAKHRNGMAKKGAKCHNKYVWKFNIENKPIFWWDWNA